MDRLGDLRRTTYAGEIDAEDYGQSRTFAGWVHDVRDLGGIAFLQLRDRTGIIQVTAVKEETAPEVFDTLTSLNRESAVMVSGVVKESEQARRGVEVHISELRVLSPAGVPLPLGVADKVSAELETRLDNRFLDLRKPEVAAVFRIRDLVLQATRDQLREDGFLEVHTPKIVATATEGGTDLFPVKYFDREAYLNQSPQLYKQLLMSGGLDRVYEIGPAFRMEKHDTVRHLNEFISIDMEMSFSDEEDAMGVLERVVKRSYEYVLERGGDVVELLNKHIQSLNKLIQRQKQEIKRENKKLKAENKQAKKDGRPKRPLIPTLEMVQPFEPVVPELPMPRVSYSDAVEIINARIKKHNENNPNSPKPLVEWGEDLSMEATRELAAEYLGWYFITRWPTAIKPFYAQPFEDSPKECRAFDLMFAEKEITSGAQRVHDPALLRANLERMGLNPDAFDFYTQAFEYGTPPHAGWGLGAARLTMILTGMPNVRECVLFPRDLKRLVP